MCWLIIGESESHSYFISDDTLHSPTYLYRLKVSVLVSVVLDVHCTAVISIHAHFLIHYNMSLPSAAESHSRGRSKVSLDEKSSVWHDTCTTYWTVTLVLIPNQYQLWYQYYWYLEWSVHPELNFLLIYICNIYSLLTRLVPSLSSWLLVLGLCFSKRAISAVQVGLPLW